MVAPVLFLFGHKMPFHWLSEVIFWLLWFCIAPLRDWLKKSRANPKPIVTCSHTFSAFGSGYTYLLPNLIGSLDCLCLLWLGRVTTLVLVLRSENYPILRSLNVSTLCQVASSLCFLILFWIYYRDTAMASITERSQRMERDLRETTEKHDRTAAELQVT